MRAHWSVIILGFKAQSDGGSCTQHDATTKVTSWSGSQAIRAGHANTRDTNLMATIHCSLTSFVLPSSLSE